MAGNDSDGAGCKSKTLCWLPPFMFCLSFSLGICCLFFMTAGGLVLCILHCVLGTVFAVFTAGSYAKRNRPVAIATSICHGLYLVLLICTFTYTAWLLGQSNRAKKDFDKGTYSPFISPLLQLYAAKAADGGALRRLEVMEEIAPLQGAELPSAEILASTDLYGVLKDPGTPLSLPLPSNRSKHAMAVLGELQDSSSDEDLRMFGSAVPSIDSVGLETMAQSDDTSSFDHMVHVAQQAARDLHVDENLPLSPQVLSRGTNQLKHVKLNGGDLSCLLKLSLDGVFKANVLGHLSALLDRGLFCGYTKYSAGSMHKWPVSCEHDCYLDRLHFSRHRKSGKKTKKLAEEFTAGVASMSTAVAQICNVLTTVTACRIQEKEFPRGVMVALGLSIIFSVILMIISTWCLIALSDSIKKD